MTQPTVLIIPETLTKSRQAKLQHLLQGWELKDKYE